MGNKIILYEKKEDCCGCGTCVLSCKQKAIRLVPKELGALYPEIDHKKCVGCKICTGICAYQNRTMYSNSKQVFASISQDENIIQKSASGGIFATIAKKILIMGGVVYGCSWKQKEGVLVPQHVGIESVEDLYKLQGSKYVQSDLNSVFVEIKKQVKKQRLTLFSGTPCQVASLMQYLKGEDTSSLYTMDIICHGVPSAHLFSEYLKMNVKKNKIKYTDYRFRDKTFGWGLTAKSSFVNKRGENKTKIIMSNMSSYYSYFLESETYRESCYKCKFANLNRPGDITIGDFWCLEKEHPEYLLENGGEINMFYGASCILVNGEKGKKLLEAFGEELLLFTSSSENVSRWNQQLKHASMHTSKRDQLIIMYEKNGYKGIEKQFRKDLGLKYYVRMLKNRRNQCN